MKSSTTNKQTNAKSPNFKINKLKKKKPLSIQSKYFHCGHLIYVSKCINIQLSRGYLHVTIGDNFANHIEANKPHLGRYLMEL